MAGILCHCLHSGPGTVAGGPGRHWREIESPILEHGEEDGKKFEMVLAEGAVLRFCTATKLGRTDHTAELVDSLRKLA